MNSVQEYIVIKKEIRSERRHKEESERNPTETMTTSISTFIDLR